MTQDNCLDSVENSANEEIQTLMWPKKLKIEHLCVQLKIFLFFFCSSKSSVQRTPSKKVLLQLHCVCKMPECFDNCMISCESCNSWFHYKCVGITCKCKDSFRCACAPSSWICSTWLVVVDFLCYLHLVYIIVFHCNYKI